VFKINFILENIWKLIKIIWKNIGIIIVLLFVISIVNSFMTSDKKIAEQRKNEKKPDYIPVDITKKYPEDFKAYGEFVEKVKKSAVKSDKKIEEDKYHAKYYDSKGREIYSIDELWGIQRNNWHSGRGGGSQERAYPKEKGIVYDENGNITGKLEINPSIQVGYISRGLTDEPRRSLFETGYNPSKSSYTSYNYDKNSNLIKEIKIKPSNWFEKEEIEYKNGKKKTEKKIIDYEVTYEDTNKIYVEITKEYDENEKLIKKFVLRKNKHNAMRSETNFDFIKGEIVTKYYDGEKDFATVTETLIGKDRAIVKRERVGDEFVIWDEYFINKKFNKYIYYNKTKELKFAFLNAKAEFEWQYNDSEVGIDKNSFNREHFYNEDIESDYSTQVSQSGDIYEFLNEDKTIKINKITYKENAKLPRKIMYKMFANEVMDSIFMEEIKNYVNRVDITSKEFEIKNNLKKLLEEIKQNGY
jgi:hypothetical protein